MSVPEQVPYKEYRATGSNNSFEITFYLPDPKDLVVMVNKEIPPVGAYSIQGNTVVFSTPPKEGDLVELTRDTQLDRETEYKSYDNSFRPETINFDLDKIWLVLQESNLVDAKILARLKQEIEWRRTHDFNYDELAQVREKQIFDALKGYADTLYSATNPNVFAGVIAGVVFALDGKSIQTHIEEILDTLVENREDIDSKAAQQYVEEQLGLKAPQETTYTKLETDAKFSAYAGGRKGYTTLALAQADQANLPVNTVVDVTNDPTASNNGTYQWNGSTLTKSSHDPLTQAKSYADANPRFLSVNLTGTENLNDLPEGRYYIKSPTVAGLLDSQLPADAASPKMGWIDKIQTPEQSFKNGLTSLVFTRYTQNSSKEYEVWRKTSNGGTSSLTWLDWQKDITQKELDKKVSINCFKNTALTAEGAFLHEATLRVEDGVSIATMDTSKISSIFYDYVVDNKIFVAGKSITLSVKMFSDGPTASQTGDISIIAYKADGAQTGSTATKQGVVSANWRTLTLTTTLPSDAVKFRIRLIRRLGNTICEFKEPELFSDTWNAKYINAFFGQSAASNTVYVSKSGNDLNTGSSNLTPKLTIQSALNALTDTGGRIIVLDSEWYRETLTISSNAHIEIVAARNKRPAIVGSNQLIVTKTASYTKVYQAPLATKPVGMGGARGKPLIAEWGTPYSVVLNEDVHSLQRGSTHRLPFTPMYEAASLAELDTPSGNGKWWWELGVIYFSATDGSDATLKQYEARVRPCLNHSNGSIYLRRIDSLFSSSHGFKFEGLSVVRDDCRSFGAYYNGFSDNANSVMSRRDVAIFNGNDGFNGTVTEETWSTTTDSESQLNATYFDPYGALNGDDGISFHVRGTCNIWGGLFEYNTKAGVVHVTGGGGNCYGTISRGQTNGFYTATPAPDGRNKSSMHCHNTIAEKNTYDYRAADDAELVCINPISDNPSGFGFYQSGSGAVRVKGIGLYKGDPAKMKSGNVLVETYTQIT